MEFVLRVNLSKTYKTCLLFLLTVLTISSCETIPVLASWKVLSVLHKFQLERLQGQERKKRGTEKRKRKQGKEFESIVGKIRDSNKKGFEWVKPASRGKSKTSSSSDPGQ